MRLTLDLKSAALNARRQQRRQILTKFLNLKSTHKLFSLEGTKCRHFSGCKGMTGLPPQTIYEKSVGEHTLPK